MKMIFQLRFLVLIYFIPVVFDSLGRLTVVTVVAIVVVGGVVVVVGFKLIGVTVVEVEVTGIVVDTADVEVVVDNVVDELGNVFVVEETGDEFVVVDRISSEDDTVETVTKSVVVSTLTVVEGSLSSLEKKNSNFTLITG